MKISLIVAMARNRVIGVENRLPWHVSADLRRFKSITLGKPILMGRKTHESIGRALPGRTNIILSRDAGFSVEGCITAQNIDQVLAIAAGAQELMVIGGSSLYQTMLPSASRLYLTLIEADIEGDTFFPPYVPSEWREIEHQDVVDDPSVPFAYRFLVLERIAPAGQA